MNTVTVPTKAGDIKRAWHVIDIKGKILGRAASDVAKLLMGKSKSYFVRNLDCGDFVIVVNAKKVAVTGKKPLLKKYYRYSGYPGGLRVDTLADLTERNPAEVVRHAVKGMLPQNKLRDRMLKRLFVFEAEEHPYKGKLKIES